jgi:hypothetical protein
MTNSWLKELMELMGWEDRHRAYHALRVVLHALRDHLTIDEVVTLGAQLPMLVRGFYYEGWHPTPLTLYERVERSLDATWSFDHALVARQGQGSELVPERNRACRIQTGFVVPGRTRMLKTCMTPSATS